MSFLRRRKRRSRPAPQVEASTTKQPKKRKVFPVEVKLLAIDALEAGLSPSEVCELVGVSNSAFY